MLDAHPEADAAVGMDDTRDRRQGAPTRIEIGTLAQDLFGEPGERALTRREGALLGGAGPGRNFVREIIGRPSVKYFLKLLQNWSAQFVDSLQSAGTRWTPLTYQCSDIERSMASFVQYAGHDVDRELTE